MVSLYLYSSISLLLCIWLSDYLYNSRYLLTVLFYLCHIPGPGPDLGFYVFTSLHLCLTLSLRYRLRLRLYLDLCRCPAWRSLSHYLLTCRPQTETFYLLTDRAPTSSLLAWLLVWICRVCLVVWLFGRLVVFGLGCGWDWLGRLGRLIDCWINLNCWTTELLICWTRWSIYWIVGSLGLSKLLNYLDLPGFARITWTIEIIDLLAGLNWLLRMGIRRREYDLVVRQEPKQARMCGVGTKGV